MTEQTTVEQPKIEGDHPLQTSWSIWYDDEVTHKGIADFTAGIKKMGTVKTVEDFCRIYSFLNRPSALKNIPSNYHLFRNETAPLWENFKEGGCWMIKMKKNTELLDHLWEQLIFSCIGEEMEEPSVVGVMLAKREREDVISVWVDDDKDERARIAVGHKLKKVLHLAPQTVVQYKPIKNSFQDKSTFKNAQTFVVAKSPSDDLIFSDDKKRIKVTKPNHKKRAMKEVKAEEQPATSSEQAPTTEQQQ